MHIAVSGARCKLRRLNDKAASGQVQQGENVPTPLGREVAPGPTLKGGRRMWEISAPSVHLSCENRKPKLRWKMNSTSIFFRKKEGIFNPFFKKRLGDFTHYKNPRELLGFTHRISLCMQTHYHNDFLTVRVAHSLAVTLMNICPVRELVSRAKSQAFLCPASLSISSFSVRQPDTRGQDGS